MSKDQDLLKHLSNIPHPEQAKSLVELGMIQNPQISDDGQVQIDLVPSIAAHPLIEDWVGQIESKAMELDWVQGITVNVQSPPAPSAVYPGGLAQVRHVLAVSSCKGGVGKSTVAVNLAMTLQKQGAKVGIFDADIYGPSLSTLIKSPKVQPMIKENLIQPIDYQGLKLMSFAYVQPDDQAAAMMRGPMVSQVVKQLIETTDWGELDYLIIDMPPGTGDIHITLAQIMPITAAIIVTTPQKLSTIDVEKGITLFDSLKIPSVGIIENMSYFQDPSLGEDAPKVQMLGPGSLKRLIAEYGFRCSAQLPMDQTVSLSADEGVPAVLTQPHIAELFSQFTKELVLQLEALVTHSSPKAKIFLNEGSLELKGEEYELDLPYLELRDNCQCAHCVDEYSGEKKLKRDDIPSDIRPEKAFWVGHYAIGVEWKPTHHSLYPIEKLKELSRVPA